MRDDAQRIEDGGEALPIDRIGIRDSAVGEQHGIAPEGARISKEKGRDGEDGRRQKREHAGDRLAAPVRGRRALPAQPDREQEKRKHEQRERLERDAEAEGQARERSAAPREQRQGEQHHREVGDVVAPHQ